MLPTPGDPPLVEQERLDRRATARARSARRCRGGEAGVERLDARAAPRRTRPAPSRAAHSSPVPKRRGSTEAQLVAVVERRSCTRVYGGARRRVEQQVAGHAQVHEQEDVAARAPRPGTCRGAPSARRAGPRSARPRPPAAPAARTSAGRAISHARERAAPRRAARAGGGSSRPREARAWQLQGTNGVAGQVRRVARRSASAGARPDVGQRPVVAAPPWPANRPPAAARARGCGRCAAWSGRSRGRR